MNPAPRIESPPDPRRRAQLDMVDLGVGISLLVIVPFVVYFVGALFIEDHYVEPMGRKPKVDAPPDREEIRMYLDEATMLLKTNAPRYLDMMRLATDGVLRDKYRQWAQRALEDGLSKLDEISNFLIPKHPEGRSVFGRELQAIARLRADATVELKRVRELDILGR